MVDATASPEALRAQALDWLRRASAGEVDWTARQQRKRRPVELSASEIAAIFELAREKVARTASAHQPAAAMALEMMEAAAMLDRAGALELEAQAFGQVARTQAAGSLVQAFVNQQAVRKQAKGQAKGAAPVRRVAVLGAGIMGAVSPSPAR